MQNTRTNQGGSVLAFIVVGAVLAIAVVGGVYLTHQRGEEASKGGSSSQPDKKPVTTTQPTTSTSTGSSSTATRQPQTGVNSNSTSRIPTTGHDSSRDSAATSGSANLPVTGPVDTMLQIIAAATLTAAVIAYVQSKLARTPAVSR